MKRVLKVHLKGLVKQHKLTWIYRRPYDLNLKVR